MQSLVPLKGDLFEIIDGLPQMTNFIIHAWYIAIIGVICMHLNLSFWLEAFGNQCLISSYHLDCVWNRKRYPLSSSSWVLV